VISLSKFSLSAPARRRFGLLRLVAARVLRNCCPALTAIGLRVRSFFQTKRRQAAAGQSGVEPPHSKEVLVDRRTRWLEGPSAWEVVRKAHPLTQVVLTRQLDVYILPIRINWVIEAAASSIAGSSFAPRS
jgi:hypothetical protein